MTSRHLQDHWTKSIVLMPTLSQDQVDDLKEALSQFALLFDNPDELVREAFGPIATLLEQHRQKRLFQDVLLAYASATPYAVARAWALVNVGDSKFGEDDFHGALEILGQARDLFRTLGDNEGLAKALIHIGDVGRFSNPVAYMDFDIAITHGVSEDPVQLSEHPIDLYKEAIALTKNDRRRQRAYLSLAGTYLMANRIDEAVEACQQALAISKPDHDIANRTWTISEALNLASSLWFRGRKDTSREIATECRNLCLTFNVGEPWAKEFDKRIDELMRG